jgi:hypothetical protein
VLAGDLNCACLEVPAQGERALGSALEHAIEAGEHLRAAKAEIPHGSWLAWLSENFGGSQPTASRYMKLAEHKDQLDYSRVNNLSIGGALKILSTTEKNPSEEEPGGPSETEAAAAPEEPYEDEREGKPSRRREPGRGPVESA